MAKEITEGPVQHVVMVWLKDKTQVELIKEKTLALKQIPQVKAIKLGSAITSERKIVDGSFDLGIIFEFDNAEDMKAYLVHPIHKEFVKNYVIGKVDKILVYDIQE